MIYGVGIISRLSSFILLPLHTAFLSQYDYGILTLVLSFIGIATVFMSYGLNVSFLRWYVPEEDPEERKKIFSICYYGITGVSLLLAVIFYLTSKPIAGLLLRDTSYEPLFMIASLILLTDALFHFPQILLQAQQKSTSYVLIIFLNVFLNLGLNYYLVVVRGAGIEGVLYAALIASAVSFLVITPVSIKNLTIYFSFKKYREFFFYGIPYVANSVFVVMINLIDRFMLERFISVETVAVYSANYKLGSAMAIIVNAFRLAWHPFFLSISKSPDAKRTYSRVFTYFLLLLSGVFLLISIFIDDLVRMNIFGFHLIAEEYWEGTFIIPWILFANIIGGAYVIFSAGIHIEKITRFTPIFTGAGIFTNVVANIFLIPLIGIYGAAISTLLGYIVMMTIQYFTVQKYYYIKYEFLRVSKIIGALLLIFLTNEYILVDPGFLTKMLLIISFPLILYFTGFFLKSEWLEMKNLTLNLLGKGKKD